MDATPLPSSLRIRSFRLGELGAEGELTLEVRCSCGRLAWAGLRGLADAYGADVPLFDYVQRIRCKVCKGLPAMVYLNEHFHREPCGGPQPGWSLILYQDR